MRLDYRVLGPLEVAAAGEAVPLGGAKQRAVLTLLLLDPDRVVPIDRIVEALWPERPPGRPGTAIQGYVSHLRKVLGAGAIRTEASGYRLVLDEADFDVHRFERLLASGRDALARGSAQAAARHLAEALALWHGRAHADFADEPWCRTEAARLEELRLVCLEERIETELALGRHAQLAGELEALVEAEPFRERPRSQLMLALYRSGRQAEALEAYQAARRTLVDELGIEPSPELKELNRGILNQDAELAAVPVAGGARTNLPSPPTPLVGRTRELERLRTLVLRDDVRLVTITGPGGIGKTRLAHELGLQLADAFPDGVFGIELSPLRDPAVVPSAIAQALGIPEAGTQPLLQTLQQALRERETLFVLDNFEHLLEAATDVAALVASAPRLKVLATSRTPLALAGEHEFVVPPLAGSEAVDLFVERARAVNADFDPGGEAAALVAEVCARLDALPLAIELAAARAKLLSPEALLARLGRRLDLLTTGRRDAPERQQTLRATIEWSHQLLDEDEQLLFERLSVFAGGWTVEAAEDVCEADIDALGSLVDKSLVRVREDRFELLETIREYAQARLEERADADDARRRHAEHYVRLAREAEPQLQVGRSKAEWLDRLEVEHDNIRAATAWALDAEPVLALELVSRIYRFWALRGHLSEGRDWLERALEQAPAEPSPAKARALVGLAGFGSRQRRYGDAEALAEEALELARAADDPALAGRALVALAWAHEEFDPDKTTRLYEESAELFRRAGDAWGLGMVDLNLGYFALGRGDLDEAAERLDESLRIAREMDDEEGVAIALGNLGFVRLEQGDPAGARAPLEEALELARRLALAEVAAHTLEPAAALAAGAGERERAARLLGAAEGLLARFDAPLPHAEGELHERTLAALRRDLGDEETTAALVAGRALALDEAVEAALELLRSAAAVPATERA